MRVFGISDLHVDYPENYNWVKSLSREDFRDDVLVLAGDISDRVPFFKKTLSLLAGKFRKVAFIPGNHDIWVNRNGISDSVKKFRIIEKIARDCNAELSPFSLNGVNFWPVHGWYDSSFGSPGKELSGIWKDYTNCRWPMGFSLSDINSFFHEKNCFQGIDAESGFNITFSHFLPRIDLMPHFIPESKRILYPVLGSSLIESVLRRLKSKIHLYGHSHVNRSVRKEGVEYINNAFGYPHEYHITAKTLKKIFEI